MDPPPNPPPNPTPNPPPNPPTNPSPERPPATEVGDAFTKQYYFVLNHWPDEICRAYRHHSTIGRPGPDGTPIIASLYATDKKDLNLLSFGGYDSAVAVSVESEYSLQGDLVIDVYGYFTLNERVDRNFVHIFYLSQQGRGFFVINEIFDFDNVSVPHALDGG